MTGPAALEIVEYTDAMCPWAWGSEPTLRWLRAALREPLADGRARWRRVFGMLFDDDDAPAPDREAETRHYERWLAGVSEHTGAPYPHHLQWVAASSRPSALVARAAEAQGDAIVDRVLRRLRETSFVDGTPADSLEAALRAVDDVPGVDLVRLHVEAASRQVGAAIDADRDETRRPDPAVDAAAAGAPHPGHRKELERGSRYALPTLAFIATGRTRFVPGWQPRGRYVAAVQDLAPHLALAPVDEDPDVLLAAVGSVTPVEVQVLCGGRTPARGRHIATRNGGLWRGI